MSMLRPAGIADPIRVLSLFAITTRQYFRIATSLRQTRALSPKSLEDQSTTCSAQSCLLHGVRHDDTANAAIDVVAYDKMQRHLAGRNMKSGYVYEASVQD